MTGGGVDSDRGQHTRFATLIVVGLISAALIAYEIVLMRRLLIESWHHFGYLVISTALLGFGASGTFLAVIERWVRARPRETMFLLAAGLGIALIAMPRLAALLPVTADQLIRRAVGQLGQEPRSPGRLAGVGQLEGTAA